VLDLDLTRNPAPIAPQVQHIRHHRLGRRPPPRALPARNQHRSIRPRHHHPVLLPPDSRERITRRQDPPPHTPPHPLLHPPALRPCGPDAPAATHAAPESPCSRSPRSCLHPAPKRSAPPPASSPR